MSPSHLLARSSFPRLCHLRQILNCSASLEAELQRRTTPGSTIHTVFYFRVCNLDTHSSATGLLPSCSGVELSADSGGQASDRVVAGPGQTLAGRHAGGGEQCGSVPCCSEDSLRGITVNSSQRHLLSPSFSIFFFFLSNFLGRSHLVYSFRRTSFIY